MDLTLATFDHLSPRELRGVSFTNAWSPAPRYADTRRAVLTGQYPQRRAWTRITSIFAAAGFTVTESAVSTVPTVSADSADTAGTFRLLEQPEVETLHNLGGVVAMCSLLDSPAAMSIYWPGVAEEGSSAELVSPLDLAPTLAAIAGLDVRPNAQLSFDGLNLVPVLRHGAAGHAALFFDDGVRMPDAVLKGDIAKPESARDRLYDEWKAWRGFMELGPLQ
ncbi:hypothetical protein ACWIB8_06070 [Corynebacterium flavescens]